MHFLARGGFWVRVERVPKKAKGEKMHFPPEGCTKLFAPRAFWVGAGEKTAFPPSWFWVGAGEKTTFPPAGVTFRHITGGRKSTFLALLGAKKQFFYNKYLHPHSVLPHTTRDFYILSVYILRINSFLIFYRSFIFLSRDKNNSKKNINAW